MEVKRQREQNETKWVPMEVKRQRDGDRHETMTKQGRRERKRKGDGGETARDGRNRLTRRTREESLLTDRVG